MANRRLEYCKRGHELTPGNLYIVKQGGRRCRTCAILHHRASRARLKPRKIMEVPEGKDIPGMEGKYRITCSGRVYSYARIRSKGAFLIPAISAGYYRVTLYKNNGPRNYVIHRLVAEAFIPNPLNLPEVNHIDGNKLNNDTSNLEWVSSSGNKLHAFRTGLHKRRIGESNRISKLTLIQAINITHCKGSISSNQLGKLYGVAAATVSGIWRGKSWAEAIALAAQSTQS